MQQANQRLRLSNVRLVTNSAGQPGASGIAENTSNVPIQAGVVRVQYRGPKTGAAAHGQMATDESR
ncbi:MAG: hypothetical protein R3E89_11555 [Thiolinea sp.]